MKKMIVFLVALAIAAPSFAAGGDVQFTPTDNGDGTCTIAWTATVINPVAMGLDIDCDQPVTAVELLPSPSFFDIFMDAAYDMETLTPGSYTYGAGNPVADQDARGGLTLPQSSFCLSMGGLGGATTPLDSAPASGSIKLTTGVALVTIDVNVLRGQIVDTDGDPMTSNLPITDFEVTDGPSMPLDHPDYDLWVYLGSPECWLYPYHDQGNTNMAFSGLDIDGKRRWVELTDLQKLGEGWMDRKMDYVADEICADFNRNFSGLDINGKRRWVELGDLQELGTAWMERAMDLPADTYLVGPGYIVVDRTE